jgi:micrococcal nuclease
MPIRTATSASGLVVAVLATLVLSGAVDHARAGRAGDLTVVRVVDGDTIVVRLPTGNETVRLVGIDTPETVKPNTPVECFGPEASARTKRLLPADTEIRLERDVEARDRYGRLLAYVLVPDGRGSWERYNDELLRDGWARLLVIAPNGRHARTMLELELAARRARRGVWGACG